jgi:formate hydrogenlyase subunit 3/multisubunit Na+/H+ antiporter MnhD subunit
VVSILFHPLNIYVLGLGGGFLLPLAGRLAKPRTEPALLAALSGLVVISGACLMRVVRDGHAIEALVAGASPPVTIGLRLGLAEGVVALCVNILALLGAIHMRRHLREHGGAAALWLIGVTGVNGMVMTGDLFSLFVFMQMTFIAVYGLSGLADAARSLAAVFKYVIATALAASFFLLATALLYHAAGTLRIDTLASLPQPADRIGATALLLLLSALLVMLKPFPANGWAIDIDETATGGTAAFILAGGAGVLFTFWKLLPLFAPWHALIAFSGGLTFIASGLLALRQVRVRRMLGYSSAGQAGLALLALALLEKAGAGEAAPLVAGGLAFNHLLAKTGLFWLCDLVGRQSTAGWSPVARRRVLMASFAALVAALAGLPPFPGFWAKWELTMRLSAAGYGWALAAILAGSLLEAACLFRWLGRSLHMHGDETLPVTGPLSVAPVVCVVALLLAGGVLAAALVAPAALWVFLPPATGVALAAVERRLGARLPGRARAALALAALILVGPFLLPAADGLGRLFGILFIAGGFVIGIGALHRADPRPFYHPLAAAMLLSLTALAGARTGLEFLACWQFATLASYFLIAHGRWAGSQTLRYLLFSLGGAFLLLAGFGQLHALTGTTALGAPVLTGPEAGPAFLLLAAGCLVQAGIVGVHVWAPGVYALADDDLSALLSAVTGKAAIFGLLSITVPAAGAAAMPEAGHLLAWLGFATALVCGGLALLQDSIKRMLAYASLSQTGYIVAAIGLMSPAGRVTALCLAITHLLTQGILFLAAAGILLRTGVGTFSSLGGLAGRMPWTFATALVSLVATAGLPPLAGAGAPWLLIGETIGREWYALAAMGFLATFVGFLYMLRMAWGIFLRDRGDAFAHVAEAPPALLAPQIVLAAGIAALSLHPAALTAAVDPLFAASPALPNPLPVMSAAMIVSLTLCGAAMLIHRRCATPSAPGGRAAVREFLFLLRRAVRQIDIPSAGALWDRAAGLAPKLAGNLRALYDGNGQTYLLQVLVYIIALFSGSRWI